MCGETSLVMLAFSAAAFRMVQALCRLIRPPRAFRNRAGVPLPLAASSGPAADQVGVEGAGAVGSQRHQPFLGALAEQPDDRRARASRLALQGDVVDVQAHGFADAGAGGIEELQQRPVAQAGGRVGAGRLEDPGDLVDADGLGQPFAGHRRVDVAGGVGRS